MAKQLFWLLFPKLGGMFSQFSGHPRLVYIGVDKRPAMEIIFLFPLVPWAVFPILIILKGEANLDPMLLCVE